MVSTPKQVKIDLAVDTQIDRATTVVRSVLEEKRSQMPPQVLRQAIGSQDFRGRVSGLIDTKVKELVSTDVRRRAYLSSEDVKDGLLDTLKPYGSALEVLAQCNFLPPSDVPCEKEVVFFQPKPKARAILSDEDFLEDFDERKLEPVDPFTLIKVNRGSPQLHLTHPHYTYWEDTRKGRHGAINYCSLSFFYSKGLIVALRGFTQQREDFWWLAGVKKK